MQVKFPNLSHFNPKPLLLCLNSQVQTTVNQRAHLMKATWWKAIVLTRFIYNQYINDHIIHPSRVQVLQTRFYNVDAVEWSPLQKLCATNYFLSESLFTSSNSSELSIKFTRWNPVAFYCGPDCRKFSYVNPVLSHRSSQATARQFHRTQGNLVEAPVCHQIWALGPLRVLLGQLW